MKTGQCQGFIAMCHLRVFRKKEIVSDVNETNLQKLFLGIDFSKLLWTVAISLRWCPPTAPKVTPTHTTERRTREGNWRLQCVCYLKIHFVIFQFHLIGLFPCHETNWGSKLASVEMKQPSKKKQQERGRKQHQIPCNFYFWAVMCLLTHSPLPLSEKYAVFSIAHFT